MNSETVKISDVIAALESVAPRGWQEDYDNTGLQTGHPQAACSGVLLCVDVTPEILAEAESKGCNMVVSHHPVMFRGVKCIAGRNRVERVIEESIRRGISIYSCHTSIDNAPVKGVSWEIARRLGLTDIKSLAGNGMPDSPALGAVGDFPEALSRDEYIALLKEKFGSPVVRCSSPEGHDRIKRVALCGGAGAEFLPDAIAEGADAYLTSDSKHNYFLDYSEDILLTDIGHFESEECTKDIFYQIITEKIPNFAVWKSEKEKNPIKYL